MKRIIPALFVVAIVCQPVHSISVKDWKAMAQRITALSKTMAQWQSYISRFQNYYNRMEMLERTFVQAYQGFSSIDDLSDILVDTRTLISAVNQMSVLKDSWAEVISGGVKLTEKYPDLENYDHIYSNRYYQIPEIKKLMDESIKNRNARIKSINDWTKYLKIIGEDEIEIGLKIKTIQDELASCVLKSGAGVQSADFAKIMYYESIIRYLTLRVKVHILTMMRLLVKNDLKERVYDADESMRLSKGTAAGSENVAKLYDSVK